MTKPKLCLDAEVVEGAAAYLAALKKAPTENDPAIVLDWHKETIERFVNEANCSRAPLPHFITTQRGFMTVESLRSDIMGFLSNVAGGRHGNCLLAPNTMDQSFNIIALLLRDVENNPWVQQVAAKSLPAGSYLATLFRIADRSIASAHPVRLVAPNIGRQLFQ